MTAVEFQVVRDVAAPFTDRVEAARAQAERFPEPDATPPTDETWAGAKSFVRRMVEGYWAATRLLPPIPIVGDDHDGNVDIVWEHGDRRVLITVLDEPPHAAVVYGRAALSGSEIRDEVDTTKDQRWILAWLTQ